MWCAQAMTAREIEGASGHCYYADGKAVEPSATARDDELAERLCMATSQLLQGGCAIVSSATEKSDTAQAVAPAQAASALE
jgi:hypothetical protein